MTSKLAQLVNTEDSMARFRLLYQIPPSVSLSYCNSDDFPVINRGEILLPVMAIVEGGVRFPFHSLLIDFLQTVNATPSQMSINVFRIIMGVIAINRLLDVNLTSREILAVYQYKCPGEKSSTLCHLTARKVNEKLVNGLPSSNKGYEKDYLRVRGEWFSGSSICRSSYGYPGDAELVRRVLSTSICVDERGEPRSAPLLLGYEPQVKSFLEGPTVPRSAAFEILPRAPYAAQPVVVEQPQDYPDHIPSGQVYAMAPPINPFKLMGKTADASSSTKAKGRGKGKGKEVGVKRKLKKPSEEAPLPEATVQPIPEPEPVPAPSKVHVLEASDQGEEELRPRKKRGRTEPSSIPAEGPSSHSEAWDPALLFGKNPISVRDSILDNSNTDVSAQVARGLAFAACLPEDMKQWAGTQPGPAFRQITRGLMMATQGVMSMEARVYRLTEKLQNNAADHEKSMSEVIKAVTDNYTKLEDEHFRTVNLLKETEERVRTEETKRAKAEAEVAEIKEKMKELQSECVLWLGNAHKVGMEEGLKKGKELGREEAMDEVTTQFKLVYNSGFRHGWKSALNKTEQPETSNLFLHTNTPLPYPDAGLKNSDDEGDEEDEEEGEKGEEGEERQEEEERKEEEGRKEEKKKERRKKTNVKGMIKPNKP
uniref:Uncharacterized protein n=1 Tax=Fagus sylvatica TaxID=28930 RepID=A0A2N9HFB0_FAGSY